MTITPTQQGPLTPLNWKVIGALAWLIVGVGTLVLDCFPNLITWLARKVGIASPVNMLFFFGFCFSLMIIFVLTVSISRMSIRIKQLAQELALHEKENGKKELKSVDEKEG